ncbi:MAG: 50S ribosomal protein L29 [Candidatus Pacebacteria bacterium]|nr:50S ribosomal protein L29 [Candidatus Paceibacterota bacterium]
MNKKEDYKKKSAKDLVRMIADAYKTLGNARFGAAGSRSKNTKDGKEAQKTIARAKTELRAREISENLSDKEQDNK